MADTGGTNSTGCCERRLHDPDWRVCSYSGDQVGQQSWRPVNGWEPDSSPSRDCGGPSHGCGILAWSGSGLSITTVDSELYAGSGNIDGSWPAQAPAARSKFRLGYRCAGVH